MKFSPCAPAILEAALPARGRILEIGCGEGDLLAHLASLGRFDLTACEPDGRRAERAERRSGLPVVQARAEALPFPDASFDAVILECVFSLCSSAETLRELTRVLRPTGRAVVADLFESPSGSCLELSNSRMLRYLIPRSEFEDLFLKDFTLSQFRDFSPALRQMFVQMLMEGKLCDCVGSTELPLLRAAKPGYGLWIWTKR